MIRTGEALAIAGRSAACIARRAGASQDGAAERCNSGARAFGLPNSQVAARYVDGMGELVTAETGEASATAERVAACTGRGASASQAPRTPAHAGCTATFFRSPTLCRH